MKSYPQWLLIAFVWVLELCLTVIFIQIHWIESSATGERLATERFLGELPYRQIHDRTERLYDEWIVESGVLGKSYAAVAHEHPPAPGKLVLAPGFFEWLKDRLTGVWALVYQIIFRLQTLAYWASGMWLLIAAALLDGVVARQVKRTQNGYANADRYAVAKHSLAGLLFVLLLYLPLPLSVMPAALPVWWGVVALSVWLLTANAQHQL
jgi:hypothetical protein